MVSDVILRSAIGLSTATAHEAAGKIGALPSRIKPVASTMRLCGRAYPVQTPAGDNLFLHHAIYAAQPGDVLVVDCGDGYEFGYWGEVMSVAAQAVALGGLVLTGGIRDARQLGELAFPIFSGNICIVGTGKDPFGAGTLGQPVRIGDVEVRRGDLVLGDDDGVMILPAERAEEIIANSRDRDAAEQEIFTRLKAGETTLSIYGLPAIGAKA